MEQTDRSGRPRRATPADVAALVRLRAVMLAAMGEPAASLGSAWREASAAWFAQRLTAGVDLVVFVVDDDAGRVVAAAAGLCESRAPSGHNPSGRVGRVFNVVTDPAHRHRGLARACTAAVLEWFVEHTTAGVCELNASEDGAALYRSLGFRPGDHPLLRLPLSR